MSTADAKTMIALYEQRATVPLFLSGFFRSPPGNYFDTETIELDILRGDEHVAPAVKSLASPYHLVGANTAVNKEFRPPIYKLEDGLNDKELMSRQPGKNPYESDTYQAKMTTIVARKMAGMGDMIQRAIEYQASQVLTTGKCVLTDGDGNEVVSIDYKPKSEHFANADVEWGESAYDPILDLTGLLDTISDNGLEDPDTLIFGDDAWKHFQANDDVLALLNNRRIMIGEIDPVTQGRRGGTYQGQIVLGNRTVRLYTYGGRYLHPSTGVKSSYVPANKVIAMSSTARLDLAFGAVPQLVPPDRRVLPLVGDRLSMAGRQLDMYPHAWLTPDDESLKLSVRARPICIPTAIDTFGCLDIEAA